MLPGSYRKWPSCYRLEYLTNNVCSEEEDPEEYPFPLTLRTKQPGPPSPLEGASAPVNGDQ